MFMCVAPPLPPTSDLPTDPEPLDQVLRSTALILLAIAPFRRSNICEPHVPADSEFPISSQPSVAPLRSTAHIISAIALYKAPDKAEPKGHKAQF